MPTEGSSPRCSWSSVGGQGPAVGAPRRPRVCDCLVGLHVCGGENSVTPGHWWVCVGSAPLLSPLLFG